MEDFTKINIDQVVSVTGWFKLKFHKIEWYDYKKGGFWCSTIKAGFYDSLDYDLKNPLTSDEVLTKYRNIYLEGSQFFRDPHIVFKMSNNETFTIFFKTADELTLFMEKPEMRKVTWIKA